MYIDSHAHLGDDTLFEDAKGLLDRAHFAGIDVIVDICTNSETLKRGISLQEKKPSVKIALVAATTPHDVEKEGEQFFEEVVEAISQKKLVAIGETGLDYYRERSSQHDQKQLFHVLY